VKFAPDARAELSRHPWPGNVRELKSTVERFMALSSGDRAQAARILGVDPKTLYNKLTVTRHIEP
jgi:DNA-binding NtrC family response regulator